MSKTKAVKLDSRKEMLNTLHLAYRHALDEAARSLYLQITGQVLSAEDCRLSSLEQYDLGRRLAGYWSVKK